MKYQRDTKASNSRSSKESTLQLCIIYTTPVVLLYLLFEGPVRDFPIAPRPVKHFPAGHHPAFDVGAAGQPREFVLRHEIRKPSDENDKAGKKTQYSRGVRGSRLRVALGAPLHLCCHVLRIVLLLVAYCSIII